MFGYQECGLKICGQFASCNFIDEQSSMECSCNPGYEGDGQECVLTANSVSCNIGENCSPFGSCEEHPEGVFKCICLPGFAGDGYTCYMDTSFDSTNENLLSENIVPIPIDKIPDYVLGGDYGNIPVEFGENPYDDGGRLPNTVDESMNQYDPNLPASGSGSGYGRPDQYDPNYFSIHDHSKNSEIGSDFDDASLRPAYPVEAPNVPAPYVPPMTPQEPLQPYQPPAASGIPEVSNN